MMGFSSKRFAVTRQLTACIVGTCAIAGALGATIASADAACLCSGPPTAPPTPPPSPPSVTPPPPPPPPGPNTTDIETQFASHQALFDLGSNFLRRLGDQSTWGTNAALGKNPGGGGASDGAAPQTFRSWAEVYGISSRTDPQGAFTGDHRRTYGGVAGLGATVLPGFNVGVSVDRSETKIDMPEALQSAKLGLTQLGFNASYTLGNWTMAGAVVHGWGDISAQRGTIGGLARSNYHGELDGLLGELSYYWALGQSRVVPKLAIEYVRAQTDAFVESGGFDPVAAAQATGERTRVLLGAEIGHYWIIDGKVLDISGYGKFVDNVAQHLSPITVSTNGQSITVQGIRESTYGADAGAGLSYGLTGALRVYANYDGKFRQNFISHQGTIGLEVKW
ncbi:MAG: autotransporter outer membrane beta-barrel domain-containing protein [Pseudomonadota bacterium]